MSRVPPQTLIESTSLYPCNYCRKSHTKQAFISHSRKDTEIVKSIKKACCASKVAPYLYEFSDEFSVSNVPADILAKKVEESEFIFVVLGDSVSKAYWTQAWIGFEIGVAVGVNNATEMEYTKTPKNFSRRIVVIQDVKQGIEVSVPRLDALFLFDFDSTDRWNELQNAVRVLAVLPKSESSFCDTFSSGNRIQQSLMMDKVRCENCRSEYEAWIAIKDAKLGKGFNRINDPKDLRFKAECTIECPSCDQMVTGTFMRAMPT